MKYLTICLSLMLTACGGGGDCNAGQSVFQNQQQVYLDKCSVPQAASAPK